MTKINHAWEAVASQAEINHYYADEIAAGMTRRR